LSGTHVVAFDPRPTPLGETVAATVSWFRAAAGSQLDRVSG
jgi:hypothetical protein